MSQQALVLPEGAEIAVRVLRGDQLRDEAAGHFVQRRAVRNPPHEHRRREELADELARPRHRVLIVRRAVAQAHHLQHARIRVRRGQEPLVHNGVHIPPRMPLQRRRQRRGRQQVRPRRPRPVRRRQHAHQHTDHPRHGVSPSGGPTGAARQPWYSRAPPTKKRIPTDAGHPSRRSRITGYATAFVSAPGRSKRRPYGLLPWAHATARESPSVGALLAAPSSFAT